MARLAESSGSPVERLADALAEDILDGKLSGGDRLPAHRDLSYTLQVGLGTVTKAYGVLERRGLVRTVKGSGTFVSAAAARRGPSIDFSRNTPPSVLTERLLARSLAAVAKKSDAGILNSYPPTAGHDEYRRQFARWLQGLGVDVAPSRLFLTSGAHHALWVAFSLFSRSGDVVFTEQHTYPGAIALSQLTGCRLIGLAMDHEGLLPSALDEVVSLSPIGRKALYVTPTIQNPTTSTMSLSRREDIVEVCRRRDVTIIEDDVYRLGPNSALPPLALLAPERTLYVNSVSKTLNPALRIGALIVPNAHHAAVENILVSTALMISPFTCAVLEQWLLDGTAEIISKAVQQEALRRHALACSALGSAIRRSDYSGYHVWLPMQRGDAVRFETEALANGIIVTPPLSTLTAPESEESGIRLCIGAPTSLELNSGLGVVSKLLQGKE
ncbi:aminotransferase-like domain-containing protein [Rhizobium sp. LEGMi198b]